MGSREIGNARYLSGQSELGRKGGGGVLYFCAKETEPLELPELGNILQKIVPP